MQTSRRLGASLRLLLCGLLLAACEQGPTGSIILFPDPSGGSGASSTGGAAGTSPTGGMGQSGGASAAGGGGANQSGGGGSGGGGGSPTGGGSSGGSAGKSSGGSGGAGGGCTSNADCAATTRYCDTAVHACRVCTLDSQCDSNKCEPAEGHCAR